jgi:hypothetical protein|tara:strand:- start:1942 stop:2085 length:144 start_codon:yes stop_codon:yes gene_type:complete
MNLEEILRIIKEAYNEESWSIIEELILDLEAETSMDALDISSLDENE